MGSRHSLPPDVIEDAVERALAEDLRNGIDLTSDAIFPNDPIGIANLVARQDLCLAGMAVAEAVFRTIDSRVEIEVRATDGDSVTAGLSVARVRGPVVALLKGERTALNFLMRMSGVATATRSAVLEIAGTGARILDTRKTIPGWRILDKYSTRCGGGVNHRMGLFDEAMIKDTHLEAAESIGAAVRAILNFGVPAAKITVEVRDRAQLLEAIAAGAGRALLDNMSIQQMTDAVSTAAGRIVLEASGGLKPGGLRGVAETGVDFLSLGWLTHSAPAADLAMEMEPLR